MNNIGLYIHIPFCVKKCNYCDFYSIKGSSEIYKEYIDSVIKEINIWKESALNIRTIDTVYIGGGTPSVLGNNLLQKLFYKVTSEFNVSSDAEITMEVNPNSVKNLDLSTLKQYGLNRVSMGLQSIKDDELLLLGRSHAKKDAENAIEQFYKTDIKNFSLDVMLGIPLQTQTTLEETLDFCINSEAEHISTYMLKIEKNTPFYTNPDNLIFADDDTLADLYEFTCKKLIDNKFRHYEISNFCKNNSISKHNMKYWILDDYLGIGPSAHSLIGSERFFYPRSLDKLNYENIIFESDGKTPEEYIMLSLRTDTGLLFEKYNKLFKQSLSHKFIERAQKFEEFGLLRITDKKIVLNEKGFLLSNTIISELLSTEI